MSHGVRIVPIKKIIELRQNNEPTLTSRYNFLSLLKNDVIAKAKGINEKLRINAVIVNITNEMLLGAPESAIIRPKSLKKLPQK
jgi:hypothetical protein